MVLLSHRLILADACMCICLWAKKKEAAAKYMMENQGQGYVPSINTHLNSNKLVTIMITARKILHEKF